MDANGRENEWEGEWMNKCKTCLRFFQTFFFFLMMVFRNHCGRLGWVELGLVGESDDGCGEGREEGREEGRAWYDGIGVGISSS